MGVTVVTTITSHACSQYNNVLWENTEWYSDDVIPKGKCGNESSESKIGVLLSFHRKNKVNVFL